MRDEHPILFSTSMVQAILAGNKTMTRRVIKPQTRYAHPYIENLKDGEVTFIHGVSCELFRCPYGQLGDRLWVRETWWKGDLIDTNGCMLEKNTYLFKADSPNIPGFPDCNYKWKPSIHMPRAASRILLEVVSVRVERVQEISEEDAVKEGCKAGYFHEGDGKFEDASEYEWTAFEEFHDLWDSINAKRGYGWKVNPWVWVVEFKVLEGVNHEKE